jgi:hypothetical protein
MSPSFLRNDGIEKTGPSALDGNRIVIDPAESPLDLLGFVHQLS